MRISDWSSDVCSSDLGGARGRAQIGVIEALEARGLRISSVAGSSSGALVGGVYAAGRLREFREGFERLSRGEFLSLLDPVVRRPGVIAGEQIGRAHVCTPVTNAQLVCTLLIEKKQCGTHATISHS